MYDQNEFKRATYEALTAHGVDPEKAQQCAEILNQQNLGLRTVPLEDWELQFVNGIWQEVHQAQATNSKEAA